MKESEKITEEAVKEMGFEDRIWEDVGIRFIEYRLFTPRGFEIEVGLAPDPYVYVSICGEGETVDVVTMTDLRNIIRYLGGASSEKD